METQISRFSNALTNFEDLQSQIRGVGLEIIPLRSGSFSCRTDALIGDDFSFTAGEFQSDHRYRGTAHENQVLLGIHFSKRGTAHFGSNEALPGDFSLLQPRAEHFGSMGGTFEYAALSMDRAALEQTGVADGLTRTDTLIERNDHIRPSPEIAAFVCDAMRRLSRVAFQADNILSPTRVQLLKRSLLYPYLLVAAYGESSPDGLAVEPKSATVRRAEDWLDGAQPQRLHVIDLCMGLGLPLRTVQRAFQDTVGMGPAHYLMYYRLHKVREALLHCDPTTARVTDVALDHGFWELGRFAGFYRRTYGERPSETLRRRMGAGQPS